MKNKLLVVISALLLGISFMGLSSTTAAPGGGTVVVIDDVLEPSLPIFKGRLIKEVCIVDYPTCPNGKNFMEGPGASKIDDKYMKIYGLDHGTWMAAIAAKEYADSNIIFIRLAAADEGGVVRFVTHETITRAMEWVLENKNRYDIQAVAMSMSESTVMDKYKYCPVYPRFNQVIQDLLYYQIPVFTSTGNNGTRNKVNWPACVPEIIAIGATHSLDKLAKYSNYDSELTDYLAYGVSVVPGPDNKLRRIYGTSISTQKAAAYYMQVKARYPKYNYCQAMDVLEKNATISRDFMGLILERE
jgi:hypothetical protein